MELILPGACAAAGGAALAAACWGSSRGACLWLGLAAAGAAVLMAVHDAGTAAAVLLVHGAVGLAALASGVITWTAAGRRRRVLPALVVVGLGTLLAAALAAGAAEDPSPPYPPRSGPLALALGGLLLLSGVIGIGALSRTRAPGGPDSGRGT